MNTKVGKPIGIALILAVAALVATLAAMSLGSTPAAAQTTDENSAVYATGDDGSTTVTVMVHGLSPVQGDPTNRLIFSDVGFPVQPTGVTFAPDDGASVPLEITDNRNGDKYRSPLRLSSNPDEGIGVSSSATITLMWSARTDPMVDPGAMFHITQLGGSDDNTAIGQISVTFPRVNLSNMTPGAAVRITLEANGIMGAVGDDIDVELPGFKVPSTISPSNIQISNGSNLNKTPSDVSVSGTTITLTIPDMDGSTTEW